MIDSDQILRDSFVRHVEHHETLPSTNALAVELLRPLLDAGPSLVITDRQTSGRGRGTNQWWSSEGALTLSLVLDAASIQLPVEQLPLLSLCAGMAVRDCVADYLPRVTSQIKWPNDVLVAGQKIAGVLVETHRTIDRRTGIVVGIGLNVNNSLAVAATELQQTATSVFDQSGDSVDLTGVLIQVLRQWQERVQQVESDRDAACSDWNRWHVMRDAIVRVRSGNELLIGRCSAIDDSGCLLLETDSGLKTITSGVIESWES